MYTLFPKSQTEKRKNALLFRAGRREQSYEALKKGRVVICPAVSPIDAPANKVFASGQTICEANLTLLRPTAHGSETSRTQKRSVCGLAASSGVLNPRENNGDIRFPGRGVASFERDSGKIIFGISASGTSGCRVQSSMPAFFPVFSVPGLIFPGNDV